MTKRFDRDGNRKNHIQSLCALQHLDYKQRATHGYEQLFLLLNALDLGDAALEQAFRRMAFNVMARNCDDHTKNFAFRLQQGGGWELAPAYDVTHAYNPKGEWTYQHLMSVNGRFRDIRRADLLAVADRFSVPRAKQIMEELKLAVARWPEFAADAGVPLDKQSEIAKDFVSP
jgi:serine/threonine-protein kinase HipA